MNKWLPGRIAGTKLDKVSRTMIATQSGHVIQCDDPMILSRLASFVEASPVAFVIGPDELLSSATRELCDDRGSELTYVETASEALKAWDKGPKRGRAVYGMFFCKLAPEHLVVPDEE